MKIGEGMPPREKPSETSEEDEAGNEVEEEFLKINKVTEEDLERLIGKYFSETCGEYGKEEFYSHVIPMIKKIYGDNYRKAGLRLLDIINQGASLKPKEIGTYFLNVFSEEELEYSKKSRKEIFEEISNDITDLIVEKKKKYGEKYQGVVGVIIYGSFAKNNFSLESDLDIIYVLESSEKGMYLEDEERYVDYEEDFEKDLKKKIKNPIIHPFSINLEEGANPKDYGQEFSESFIAISPNQNTKIKIEEIFRDK